MAGGERRAGACRNGGFTMKRRRALARRNPIESRDIGRGIGWLGTGAVVGAAIGAVVGASANGASATVSGALGGGFSGIAVTAVGSLVAAAVSKPLRSPGLAAAGIGLGSLMLLGIVGALAPHTAP
jgi:hypothetical protein